MELFKILGSIAIDNSKAKTAIKETTTEAKKGSDETSKAFEKIGSVAGGIAKGIGAVGLALGGSFIAAVEGTREYRKEMGLLESAFLTAGHTSEEAKNTYSELNAVMGDSGAAVEASQHLALVADNEAELNEATHTLTGVYATFGASLPLEGLAEAINHSASLGEVQGSLADALEWSGITVDDFNAQLAECSSEEERQDLIMKTLKDTYSKAADQYKETNKDIIEAEKANEKLSDAFSKLGETFEPIMTTIKNKVAEAMDAAIPKIESFIDKIKDCADWVKDNEDKIKALGAVVVGATVSVGAFLLILNWGAIMGAAASALNTLKIAIMAVNTAMKANPIGLVVSLIAGLVAAIIYLWNTNESFRKFWINAWEAIKKAASAAWEAIKNAWDKASEWFSNIWQKIKDTASDLWKNVKKFFSDAWQSIKDVWNACTGFFQGIWNGIKSAFSSVGSWIGGQFKWAWDMVKTSWNAYKTFFSDIWNGIKGIFGSVGTWFRTTFNTAWSNIKSVFNGWGTFFGGLWDSIKSKFSSIGSTLGSTMSNAVKTGMNAVIGKIESTINKGLGLINSAIRLANKLGFNVGEVGTLTLPRLAKGALIKRPTTAIIGEDGAEAVVPLEKNTEWIGKVATEMKSQFNVQELSKNILEGLYDRMDMILDRMNQLMERSIYLDTGLLVGEMAPSINDELGNYFNYSRRYTKG